MEKRISVLWRDRLLRLNREQDMTTATQIKALLQSHGSGDEERFYAIALQVAAGEARRGHEALATEIKKLVDQAKLRRAVPKVSPSIFHVAQPQGEAAELLEEVDLRLESQGPDSSAATS